MPRPTGCEQGTTPLRGKDCTNIDFQFCGPQTNSIFQLCIMTTYRSLSVSFADIKIVQQPLSR